jgi:hypothetical protein
MNAPQALAEEAEQSRVAAVVVAARTAADGCARMQHARRRRRQRPQRLALLDVPSLFLLHLIVRHLILVVVCKSFSHAP